MINATQARALAEESEVAINTVVERISIKIEEAAKLGKTEIDLQAAMNYDTRFEVAHKPYHQEELNPWQSLVRARLKKEGFQVLIKQKTVQIGGGFKSMDDEHPREELRPYIQVSW